MSIVQTAMIAKLNISVFGIGGKDDQAGKTVKTTHGLNGQNAGYYHKYKISRMAIRPVSNAASAARAYHKKITAAWGDEGDIKRILPAKRFLEYTQEMSDFKRLFNDAVHDFIMQWPTLVINAQADLGSLWNANEYIDVSKLPGEFSFKSKVEPIATADDWRVDLSKDEIEKIKRETTKENEIANAVMLERLFKRIYDPVKTMATTLKDQDKVFHKTLIGNIADIADILPDLNVLGNPDLDVIIKDVQARLCYFSPKEIRKDPVIRKEAADAAQDIANNMEGFLGKAV